MPLAIISILSQPFDMGLLGEINIRDLPISSDKLMKLAIWLPSNVPLLAGLATERVVSRGLWNEWLHLHWPALMRALCVLYVHHGTVRGSDSLPS